MNEELPVTTCNSTSHDGVGSLTEEDLSAIREKGDLIAKVEERYSLPHWVAVQDVELWAQQTFRG